MASLSQRINVILRYLHTRRVIYCGGIGASSLSERFVRGTAAREQTGHAVISFVTPWLVIDPIRLLVLPGVFLLDRPRFGPPRRIVHRCVVPDRFRHGVRRARA